MPAVDALRALEMERGGVDVRVLQRGEATIYFAFEAIAAAGHAAFIPRFARAPSDRYCLWVRTVVRTLIFAALLAGCPRPRRTLLEAEPPRTGDANARAKFQDAKAQFLRDGTQGPEFAKIVRDYPADPIVPWAQLYAGIAAIKARDFSQADKVLAQVASTDRDPGLAARGALFLGIAKNYEGDPASAHKLLVANARAVDNDDERTEYIAALAYSTAAGERPLDALPQFDELYARPGITATERAVAIARIEQVVSGADGNALRRVYDELADRKGPSIAIVGSRLALIAERSGDPGTAAKLRTDLGPVRTALGLPRTIREADVGPAAPGSGSVGLIGAVMPFGSGSQNKIASKAAAALGLAAGAPDGKGVAAIEVRAAPDAATAADAVDQLARLNVVAIIGPIDGESVDAATVRADAAGVPLLSLSAAAEKRNFGKLAFHIRHSAEARARVLAHRALAEGATRFAVLAPENGYGKAITAAFAAEIVKGGGAIVSTVTYPKDTKSFSGVVGKLGNAWQAIFVPDQAEKLGLIAPALAAAGDLARAMPFPKKLRGGRPVLLLSTAEDLTPQYVIDAGRHSEGALFAPGYYPDDQDAASKPFLDRYVAAFGHPPGALEAYAFDAAQLAAAAGAGGRSALAATLASGQLVGLTGTIKFDREHRRADDGVIYTVVEESGGAYAVRVAR